MRPTDGVVMDEDNLDIYGDLNEGAHQKSTLPGGAPSLDDTLNDEALLYNELNSLEVEVKALRKDRKSLAEENATLKSSLTAKERQIQVLRNNISSLYKTAKLELERRSQELADVRREYDSLVFRRRTSQLDSAFQSVEPSISTVNVSTDTSDLISSKCHNPLSTKENQSRRREEYSNYSQPAEASKEGQSSRSYPCDWPHCGMWFSQSSNLNKHYLTHTNEKPFKCLWPNCNKSFKQSSNLNKHRFVHTGEKPFACDYPQCNKRFSQSSNLKKHKMVHSGEKPYHCQYPGCSKVFDQSSNLNKHLLIHMGQKPHSCSECGEKFSQNSNLMKHMRKHGQYNFKDNSENSSLSEEANSRLLVGSQLPAGGCYTNNGSTGGSQTTNSSLPVELTHAQKGLDPSTSAAAAMTAAVAANAFFNSHTKQLINSFDTLDPKFMSAHTFLNPTISLPSTFAQPATSSTSNSPQSLSRLHSSDHFSSSTPENGLEMANSPDDPNRYLSMKLSVPSNNNNRINNDDD